MTFRLRLIEAGLVPPAGGPARTGYLLHHGEGALAEARALEAFNLRRLGLTAELPHAVVTGDMMVDLVAAALMREQWEELRSNLSLEDLQAVKPDVIKAADLATQALNFLEDLPLAADAHDLIHSTALLRGGLYGCPLWVENDEVWTDCPVRISHLRVGVSLEMSTVWHCSICDLRFDLCDHDPDALYEVEAQRTAGACTVCFGRDCEHEEGARYLVRPIPVADSISGGAVAWVARPRYPQARIVRMTLDYGGEAVSSLRPSEAFSNVTGVGSPARGFEPPTGRHHIVHSLPYFYPSSLQEPARFGVTGGSLRLLQLCVAERTIRTAAAFSSLE